MGLTRPSRNTGEALYLQTERSMALNSMAVAGSGDLSHLNTRSLLWIAEGSGLNVLTVRNAYEPLLHC